tara:strand:- start:172 stop:1026 length:855 start_codon:yes stop_codon:yes gene_type:complete
MPKKIFLSTGGFSNRKPAETVRSFIKNKIVNIELSSGKYSNQNLKEIIKLKKQCNFVLHNYFPPPKKPFVMNLASKNKIIFQKTKNLILKSVRFSKKINSNYYAFHAGFCFDPDIKKLGQTFKKSKLLSKKLALNLFKKRVLEINKLIQDKNFNLLIENNVITKKNFNKFGRNPLLLTNPLEIKKFFEKMPKNVGLLLDVGHLKVSAETEEFSAKKAMSILKPYIKGYHLSDNSGLTDSNKAINKKSWFIPYLKKNIKYVTLEVYNLSILKLKSQIKFAEKLFI